MDIAVVVYILKLIEIFFVTYSPCTYSRHWQDN